MPQIITPKDHIDLSPGRIANGLIAVAEHSAVLFRLINQVNHLTARVAEIEKFLTEATKDESDKSRTSADSEPTGTETSPESPEKSKIVFGDFRPSRDSGKDNKSTEQSDNPQGN